MSSTKVSETVETCYHRPNSPFTSEIGDFFHPRKLAFSNVYEILSEAAVDYSSMLNGIP